MASVNFIYRSKKETAKLNMRLRHHHTFEDGSRKNHQIEIRVDVIVRRDEFKAGIITKLNRRELEDIEEHVLNAFRDKKSKYFKPTKHWLQNTYNYYNKTTLSSHSLLGWIDNYVEHLILIGRSKNRIKGIRTLKNKVKEFDASLEMHELNISKLKEFYGFLITKKLHKESTAKKTMSDLKIIGSYAKSMGADIDLIFFTYKNPTRTNSQIGKTSLKPIVLNLEEVDAIYNLELTTPYLVNVRKWIILAIYTAQRGGDVMKHIVKDNFIEKNGKLFIDFTQDKTGNHLEMMPALKRVSEIYYSGKMPHSISLNSFNKYTKEVCKLAGIDTIIEHYKLINVMIDGEKKQRKRLVKGKKYEFIASHTFRRTFCTLYFGKMKNQDIMKISGHKKESEFLKYIGKKDVDYSVWDSEL